MSVHFDTPMIPMLCLCIHVTLTNPLQTNILDFSKPEDVLIATLRESLTRYGFVQIKNPVGLIEDMQDIAPEMVKFFEQPMEEKMKLTASKPWQFGYIPLNFETTNGIKDTREIYAIGTYPATRVELGLPSEYAYNYFPDGDDMAQFSESALNLLGKMHHFSIKITEYFCKTLDQNEDCLKQLFQQNSSELRFTKYVSLNESDESVELNQGVGEHTDSGFMAFIFQTCKGLEFYDDSNGEWITVDYHNDTIIVNIGDIAKLLSNGLYLTPKHRVKLQKDTRYTVLYFFNPNYNEPIQPLANTNQHKYQTLTWKQYLNERFNGGSYSSKENRKNLNDFLIQKTEL